MTPQRSFRRKIIYLVAIGLLLIPLFLLGQPSTSDVQGAKGSPGGKLAQLRDEYQLSQVQLGEIDPTSETIKLATLGLRGVAANVLWGKATNYKMKKDWTNLSATLQQLAKLQPHFLSVWQFQAWNLSYNVSAEFDDYRERYRWVIKGIEFLKKGTKYNEREARLQWDIGWFISQKIGRADEHKQFRRLFKEDDDFHGSRPLARRDNWLVGREWYLEAEEMVDTKGAKLKGMSPLIFRADAPMCLMNYADALEVDGVYGEVAKRAWMSAGRAWHQYGAENIPTYDGLAIRLSEQEMRDQQAEKLVEQLDELAPGLREKIVQEKRADLTDEDRQALDTPPAERTEQQHKLASDAKRQIEVTHEEVAKRVTGPYREKAMRLAKEAAEVEHLAGRISRYRQIVNYLYWQLRAKVEQTDEMLSARKSVYEGDQAFADAKLLPAKEAYDRGLAAWRKVLDQFPSLIPDQTTGEDLMDVINRYRRILSQLDEKMPEPFILQDIIDKHGDAS